MENIRSKIDATSATCQIDGRAYPAVGFGTYPLTAQVCTDAVRQAVKAGYRIIDTATYYRNFGALAKALKGSARSEFYIISKVWHDSLLPVDIHQDIKWALEQLKTDYLDAYLVHWPNSQIPIEKTLTAMEDLRQTKKIRHIGLSNVTVNHLRRALEVGVPLTWVQVEMHPYFYDEELLTFCKKHDIAVQAWSPLGRGLICDDLLLARIGQKHRKTSSQVAIRWILQHHCLPLPNSKNEQHIRENRDVADFLLSAEEMQEIDQRAKLGARKRIVKERMGFIDEFDFSYEECWPK